MANLLRLPKAPNVGVVAMPDILTEHVKIQVLVSEALKRSDVIAIW